MTTAERIANRLHAEGLLFAVDRDEVSEVQAVIEDELDTMLEPVRSAQEAVQDVIRRHPDGDEGDKFEDYDGCLGYDNSFNVALEELHEVVCNTLGEETE